MIKLRKTILKLDHMSSQSLKSIHYRYYFDELAL